MTPLTLRWALYLLQKNKEATAAGTRTSPTTQPITIFIISGFSFSSCSSSVDSSLAFTASVKVELLGAGVDILLVNTGLNVANM